MHDRLRAYLRSVTDAVAGMTRLLPSLGFGRAEEPPTERIREHDTESELPAVESELQEQQHVDAAERLERGHPKR